MEQLSAAAYACAELVFSVCLVCRRHAGLYALYAAALGADVVAVEPQSSLCRLILASANYNARAAVRAKLPLQPLLPSNLRACSCYAIMHAYSAVDGTCVACEGGAGVGARLGLQPRGARDARNGLCKSRSLHCATSEGTPRSPLPARLPFLPPSP